MLRAADLTPELVDAATEALLMSHRKFSETRLEAMRFTAPLACVSGDALSHQPTTLVRSDTRDGSATGAIGSVVFTLLTSSLVAYALARNLHRPFFKGVFYYLLAALFVPFPIIMLPLVKQTSVLGLDNPAGMIILYTIYGLSLNVFIYTAFIRSIPIELEEAARMDGASTWRVFRQIVFPLLMPMNATVGILTCVWAWNDFIMPLVVLTSPSDRTLSLAQYVFQGQYNTDYTVAFASYLMAMAPLLIVYIFSQRWVISGVMRGSIK